jgi:hypothetical protein
VPLRIDCGDSQSKNGGAANTMAGMAKIATAEE